MSELLTGKNHMRNESIELLDSESLRRVESILKDVPEMELLLQCINRSQIDYLFYLRNFFRQVSKGISNYFSGKPLFEGVDITLRERIELELEKWLCFYALIQAGWEYIMTEALRKGWEITGSPGDILHLVIRNHAEYLFAQHQADYLEFSPRKGHKQISLIPKLESLINKLENGGSIGEDDIKLINAFNEASQKGDFVRPELNDLYEFCLEAFNKHKNKPRIKHKYKDFLRIQSEYEVLAARNWHPNKKSRGHQVVNQELHSPS